jgi:hypothetical protein
MNRNYLIFLIFNILILVAPKTMWADEEQALIPLPKSKQSLESYCKQFSADNFLKDCFSKINYIHDTSNNRSEHASFTTDNFGQVFKIASRLYGIPNALVIPTKGSETEVFEEPNKPDNVWISALEITRTKSGLVNKAQYTFRQEGYGYTVQIERKDNDTIEIIHSLFSD